MCARVQIRVAPLPDPNWSYLQYFEYRCNPGWEDFVRRSDIRDALQFAEENVMRKAMGVGFLPPKELTFRTFDMLGPQSVRVVIVGQDPYPTPEHATGLAFSVWRHQKPPPSLRAVYDELVATVPGFQRPEHGDLSAWVMQGVMLLNSSLTVNQGKGKDASHKKIWTWFLLEVLKEIVRQNPRVILVFWGGKAKELRADLVKEVGERIKTLEAGHPSPMNFHSDFKGCNHFNKINEYLRSLGEVPIDWQV